MRLELEPNDGAGEDLVTGCLVEVDGGPMLYLGQVHGREGNTLVVGVEHAVDRRVLSAVREAWGPGRG